MHLDGLGSVVDLDGVIPWLVVGWDFQSAIKRWNGNRDGYLYFKEGSELSKTKNSAPLLIVMVFLLPLYCLLRLPKASMIRISRGSADLLSRLFSGSDKPKAITVFCRKPQPTLEKMIRA